jgi:hypothetical protein
MKKTVARTLVFVLILSAITSLGYARDDGTVIEDADNSSMLPFPIWLRHIGKRVDCYFTQELKDGSEGANQLVAVRLSIREEFYTVSDVVKYLKSHLDSFDVTQESNVISLVDKDLKQIRDYWLDRKISLDHSAVLSDCLVHLLSELKHVKQQSNYLIGTFPIMDGETNVWMSGEGVSARKMLTKCIPFSRYSRVLWNAVTEVVSGEQVVRVSFGGQAKRASELSETLIPFSDGEKAYRENADSEEGKKAATNFVAREMKKKTPHQVRWAMLYLGRCGGAAEVPLLLKHLKYRYSEVGPLEERYPAVQSLVMLKEHAVGPVIGQLQKETDPIRAKLLAYVVLAVKGVNEGKELLLSAMDKSADKEQRERVESAIESVITTTKLKAQTKKESNDDANSPKPKS